ncbi:MAG: lysine--tRNA ligase [Magnetococcales bacterium]|nr:lysine--tRNA ligase [Magnetococcales bacterium]
MQETHSQIEIRREKARQMRAAGVNPYPNDFRPSHSFQEVRRLWGEEQDADVLAACSVRVAGRLMLLRSFGKLTFATLRDDGDFLQIALQRDILGEEGYREILHRTDVGDILGVEGGLFRTRTGELTVRVKAVRLLTKSLRPLPEKFHGLEDTETRFRQRYVDLAVNPEVRELFRTRSRIIQSIRAFMVDRGFLEVETPMMHPIPGGANARPFVTHHNALDCDLYLRIAPELYLKRLVVGGFERVFEINRNFRNEGLSIRHNPEFTMMEFYQAYADYRDLMQLTEELVVRLVQEVTGGLVITYQGRTIDFTPPWSRLDLPGALVEHAGADPARMDERAYLESFAREKGLTFDPKWDDGKLLLELFEELVESSLQNPTFMIEYPVSVSPLARRSDTRPHLTDRFELFIGGWEVANAFSELNDPDDQAERFRLQAAAKVGGDEEAMHFDHDYIRALEYGMPPTAGEGIGIDRLVMLLTNAASIREVLLFPQMRPEARTVTPATPAGSAPCR